MSSFDKLYSGLFGFMNNFVGDDFSISSILFMKSILFVYNNIFGLEPSISKLYKFKLKFLLVFICLNFFIFESFSFIHDKDIKSFLKGIFKLLSKMSLTFIDLNI